MDEIFVKIIFGILMIAGIIGSILPVLPGSPLVFGVLLTAKILGYSELSWWLVIVFGFFTGVGILLDYLIPAATVQRLGGSRYGLIGLAVGFIIGILFSPFGFFSIIAAPFLGALTGELIYDRRNHRRAIRAATGSVIGYILATIYGLVLSFLMFAAYLFKDIL